MSVWVMLMLVLPTLCVQSAHAQSDHTVWIDDFEDVSDWKHLEFEPTIVQKGSGAGRWSNHADTMSIKKRFVQPLDVTGTTHLQFWLYSGVANAAGMTLVLDSEDSSTDRWGIYHYDFLVDWTGWRLMNIPLTHFEVEGVPVGWHVLTGMAFEASGWSHTPKSDSSLVFDNMKFVRAVISDIDTSKAMVGTDFVWAFSVELADTTGRNRNLAISIDHDQEYPFQIGYLPPTIALPANGTATISFEVTVPAAYIADTALTLAPRSAYLYITEGSLHIDSKELIVRAPLPDHPRLFLQASDVAELRARYEHHGLRVVRERLRQQAATSTDGISVDGKADADIRRVIEAKAFLYLIQNDEMSGRQSIDLLISYLGSITQPYQGIFESRRIYQSMISAAMVYDWCYDLLSPQQRLQIIAEVKRIATLAECDWPAPDMTINPHCHYSEDVTPAFLASGIAFFDEDTDLFDRAYRDYFSYLVPMRNFYYRSGKHPTGTSYGVSRFFHEIISTKMFLGLGLSNPYRSSQAEIPYYFLYALTPAGSTLSGLTLTEGDASSTTNTAPVVQLLTAQIYRDPYIMTEGNRIAIQGYHGELADTARTFIYWDPTVPEGSLDELPLVRYFGSPEATMLARTGWDIEEPNSNVAGSSVFCGLRPENENEAQLTKKGLPKPRQSICLNDSIAKNRAK